MTTKKNQFLLYFLRPCVHRVECNIIKGKTIKCKVVFFECWFASENPSNWVFQLVGFWIKHRLNTFIILWILTFFFFFLVFIYCFVHVHSLLLLLLFCFTILFIFINSSSCNYSLCNLSISEQKSFLLYKKKKQLDKIQHQSGGQQGTHHTGFKCDNLVWRVKEALLFMLVLSTNVALISKFLTPESTSKMYLIIVVFHLFISVFIMENVTWFFPKLVF